MITKSNQNTIKDTWHVDVYPAQNQIDLDYNFWMLCKSMWCVKHPDGFLFYEHKIKHTYLLMYIEYNMIDLFIIILYNMWRHCSNKQKVKNNYLLQLQFVVD